MAITDEIIISYRLHVQPHYCQVQNHRAQQCARVNHPIRANQIYNSGTSVYIAGRIAKTCMHACEYT